MKVKVRNVKREALSNGPIMGIIRQTLILETFEQLEPSREKRAGKAQIPVETVFTFYRDRPQIDVTTKLTNTAKDHRLRICFDVPFVTERCKTASHFGYVERSCEPSEVPSPDVLDATKSSFPEMPSGIQPQKRFIRIEDPNNDEAVTVFNKGLPEVEVLNKQTIALTLVRSIGWLSRSDYPERPMHAGPGEETPGAQELGIEYEYQYGLVLHSKNESMDFSADVSEAATIDSISISFENGRVPRNLLTQLVKIENPSIRISSLRMKDGDLLVTFYNLSTNHQTTSIKFWSRFTKLDEIKIGGSKLVSHKINDGQIEMSFTPREIKMCRFGH
jgi:alpha-mannosidase